VVDAARALSTKGRTSSRTGPGSASLSSRRVSSLLQTEKTCANDRLKDVIEHFHESIGAQKTVKTVGCRHVFLTTSSFDMKNIVKRSSVAFDSHFGKERIIVID
jgi:hypothetical protein